MAAFYPVRLTWRTIAEYKNTTIVTKFSRLSMLTSFWPIFIVCCLRGPIQGALFSLPTKTISIEVGDHDLLSDLVWLDQILG